MLVKNPFNLKTSDSYYIVNVETKVAVESYRCLPCQRAKDSLNEHEVRCGRYPVYGVFSSKRLVFV